MATMTPEEANLDAIKTAWSNIHFNYNAIASKCSAAEKKKLDQREAEAFLAVLIAGGRILKNNSDEVKRIRADLKTANDDVELDVKTLNNVSNFLTLVAKAVQLAATLAVIAGA